MTNFFKPILIAAMALPIVTVPAAQAFVVDSPADVTFAAAQPDKPVPSKPEEKPAAKPAAQPETKPQPAAPTAPDQPAAKPPVAPQPDKPAPAPKPPETPTPDEALPNLDDLLGIPGQPKSGEAGVPDPSKMDLDRLLTGDEIGDAFKEAVTLMGDAAKRLKEGKDASLTTQRLQESIVRRLDQLLSSLDQQQQQQQSSSSQQQQNQDKKQSQNVPSQQQGDRKEESKSENDGTATTPPGRRDGALRPGLEAVRSSWGMLPARVRDMLVQGSNDTFSSMYEKMTEAYYKKLAEQGKAK